jgi:hypothetical protein
MFPKAYASCTWSWSESEGGGDSSWSGDIDAELGGEGEDVRVNEAVKFGEATVIIGWTCKMRMSNEHEDVVESDL